MHTDIELQPTAGEARVAFYDFTGRTNQEAREYLQVHAAEDLAALRALDFRPGPVQTLDPAQLRADAERLLTDAAEDGVTLRPAVEKLLARVDELQAQAAQRDWRAEAELGSAIVNSEDLFWKLRTFAVLNNP